VNQGGVVARVRTAILISGRGSNMTALLAAAADPAYPAEIVLVLSNRADADGLAHAASGGIPTAIIPSRGRDRATFEHAIEDELARHDVALIALAGFMRVLGEGFVTRWQGRMVNIHPSLLPAFPGLDTHARALAAGVARHGCTVHLVSAGVDEGPVLAQASVPVLADDTPQSLGARVLAAEHRLYPATLAMLARRLANPLPALSPLPKTPSKT